MGHFYIEFNKSSYNKLVKTKRVIEILPGVIFEDLSTRFVNIYFDDIYTHDVVEFLEDYNIAWQDMGA